ncbi:hypothetical protein [Salipiger thiooxidans]|uniref:hypothetical protein n=1 Tax=Salipiger thiooxidans TaxID=282683 RepID=UPI001CD3D0CB|nr:hypothetical protein [Salipiger thiooxidans]MCA0851490.1 hypothetical protein [Salipiger thiooxidans]
MTGLTGQLALGIRVFVLLPAAGAAAVLPFVDFDKAAGLMTIDVNAASTAAAGAIYAAATGSTFAWSRWAKRRGGAT